MEQNDSINSTVARMKSKNVFPISNNASHFDSNMNSKSCRRFRYEMPANSFIIHWLRFSPMSKVDFNNVLNIIKHLGIMTWNVQIIILTRGVFQIILLEYIKLKGHSGQFYKTIQKEIFLSTTWNVRISENGPSFLVIVYLGWVNGLRTSFVIQMADKLY